MRKELTNKRFCHLDVAALLFNVVRNFEQVRLGRRGEDQPPHSFTSSLCAARIKMSSEGGLHVFDIEPLRIGNRRRELFAQPGQSDAGIDGCFDAAEAASTHLRVEPFCSL